MESGNLHQVPEDLIFGKEVKSLTEKTKHNSMADDKTVYVKNSYHMFAHIRGLGGT